MIVNPLFRIVVRSLILAYALMTTVACGVDSNETPANQADREPLHAQVELDVFSGNPNPVWSLSETESTTLRNRVGQLPSMSEQPFSDGLGYRGFLVAMTKTTSGRTASIRVQGEIIAIDQGGTVRFVHDSERTVEQWLLETARPHIDQDLYQSLKTEQQGAGEDEET